MELRVAEVRKAMGWTQSKLSEKSGVSESTISKIETGKVGGNVSSKTFFKLSHALKIKPELLIIEDRKTSNDLNKSIEIIQRELVNISKMNNLKAGDLYRVQDTYGFSNQLMTEIFFPKAKMKDTRS